MLLTVKWCECFGKRSVLSYKHTFIIWPSNSIPRYMKEIWKQVHTKTYTQIIIAALFILVTNWKQSKCPSKVWGNHIYLMALYSVEKISKILTSSKHKWVSATVSEE